MDDVIMKPEVVAVMMLTFIAAMALYCLYLCLTDPIVREDREKKRVRRRKLGTPPCSKCMRGFFDFGMWHCNCPEYKEHVERLTTRRLEYVAASDIRGTKWCRYEPGLEDGEGI